MEHDWTEIAQGVGSLASAIISLLGFYFLYRQISQTNENLRQSNHTAIYSINTEIYKFFAENSELRPYFHENKPLNESDKNKVLSISELLGDFFEFIIVEKDSLAPEIKQPWLNYMKKIYANSPGFRLFIHDNKEQYSEELLSVFANVAPTIPEIEIECRTLSNEIEFYELDTIYQNCFGTSSVPTDVQKSWWQSQKSGIFALFKNSQIIGGVSFWNINHESYKLLTKGIINEKQILPEHLSDLQSGYFYISEVVVSQEHRNKKYSLLLLRKVITFLEEKIKKGGIQILALGYSNEGISLLSKLGFEEILSEHQTPDKQPLYLLRIKDYDEILKLKKITL